MSSSMRVSVWLAVYALAACALTWPLVVSPLVDVPGAEVSDLWNALWVLQWQADSLWSGQLPYQVDVLNHPTGGTLVPADPWSFGWSLLCVPVLGPLVTLRLMVLSRLITTGLVAHGFSAAWLKSRGLGTQSAFIAGLALMASPSWLVSVHNGVPEGLHGGWMVLAIWASWCCARQPSAKRVVVVALAWLGLALASWYLLIPGAALAVGFVVAERPRLRSVLCATLAGLIPVGMLAALMSLVLSASNRPLGKATRKAVAGLSPDGVLEPPLVALVDLVRPLTPLMTEVNEFRVVAYLGAGLCLVGGIGLIREVRWAGWGIWVGLLGLVVLSLGNSLALTHESAPLIALPLTHLRWVPGVWALEHTWRVLPGAALALGVGAAALAARWRRPVQIVLVLIVVLDLRQLGPMSGPLVLSEAAIPAAVAGIQNQPDGAVLSVPLGESQGWTRNGFHQTIHGHPVLWAFDAHPNEQRKRFLSDLQAAWLAGEPLAEAAAAIGESSGIRYLVITPGPEYRRSPYGRVIRNLERSLTPLAGSPPTEMRSYRLW